MEPEDKKAVEAAAADATNALRRLAELSRKDNDLSSMVTVLDALKGDDGPLRELSKLFYNGGQWIVEFEDDVFDTAADRLGDAAEHGLGMRHTIEIIQRMIRPLAD